jgi:hypothetical protein
MTREEIGTLWAGGWDDYAVDTDDVINDPGTGGTDPLIYPGGPGTHGVCSDPHYVRACFSAALRNRFPNKAVRVLEHLGGGD